jgi:adenylate cyclase
MAQTWRNALGRRKGGRAFLMALLAGGVLSICSGLLFRELPLGDGLQRASYDLLFVARGDIAATNSVLIYMDEDSHQRLNQPLNAPWDRSLHAKLIERLTLAGARAIVFDIVFSDPIPAKAQADSELIEAIKKSGRVILAADNVPIGPGAKKIIPPFPLLFDVTAGVGSDELVPDGDLIIRRHTARHDNLIPSLSWVTAEFLKLAAVRSPHEEQMLENCWLNYYGRPGLLPWKSYWEALDSSLVPDTFFRNKVVFVGARLMTRFAGERKDEYPNPFSVWQGSAAFMPGAEIQATAFLNLLRKDWIMRSSLTVERVLLILFGAFYGAGLVLLRPTSATLLSVLCAAVVVFAAYQLFISTRLWFTWVKPVVQIGVALAWSVLFNSVQLYVQKRLLEHTLSVYLPPKLVAKFANSPHMLKPGAEKQRLTFLFTDIENFTTTSEKMDGDELALMMNEYFQPAVDNCIHKTEGTVVKFIGDSIFAFWNAPELHPDHPARACEAALLLRDQSKLPVRGRILRTRIGLHTGVANVGNFGSEEKVDYTAIGESVNLASRLEGLNKYLGTDCLISGGTQAELGERFVTRKLGEFQLKGFAGFVQVYELVGFLDVANSTRAWREAFTEALNNFEQRNLPFAEIGFHRVLELKPDDGPAKFYLGRIAELSHEELPESWATQTIIKEK